MIVINKKRFLDIYLTLVLLIITIPLFLISYLPLIFVIGSPIIFKQKRLGKNKKEFIIYKIRTMKKNSSLKKPYLNKLNIAPKPMFKIKNDPRFHKLGKFLSHSGLDELPQFINIIKGEMSLVGPRPLPTKEAKQLNHSWDFRYQVLPGIISPWAVSPNRYQSLTTWKKLEKQTVEQVLGYSVKQDLLLIIQATWLVLIKPLTNLLNRSISVPNTPN